METIGDRLSRWWTGLSEATKERLLALEEDDLLPHDVVANLSAAGIFPLADGFMPERDTGPSGIRQPHELRAFLTEQRRA